MPGEPPAPSEREAQGPSGPSEREAQGPSGPSEREAQGPSGPSEREAQGLLRPTLYITAGNLASRLTGFARVAVVAAVLGTTFLGNTYQTANLVSNILFELLAAGLLSSVLVPPFVRLLDGGKREEAERLAGALLGLALVVLGSVTVVALVARPWIMRALTVAVSDDAVRAEEVRLGSFLLILFLPQLVLYAIGGVATALLHGARRFAVPAFAPVANNVAVILSMALFWAMADASGSGPASLDLPVSQRLVLALGATLGVAAMALVPLVGARRAGLRLRPRWAPGDPELRALGRGAAWAAAYLALTQLLVITTVVLANRVPGGVVACQLAFTVFLLPYALLAQPTITTLYPRLAADGLARRWRAFSAALTSGTGTIAFLVLPASALLWAVGEPAISLIRFGNLDVAGVELAARVVDAYAIGLVGYAGFHLLTRASYAAGDTRTPTLVNATITVGGSALMVGLFVVASGDDRVAVLGLAHSVAMLAAAGAMWVLVRRRVGESSSVAAPLARAIGCGLVAAALGRVVGDALPAGTRPDAALALVLAGGVTMAVYLAGQWCLRSPELRRLRPARIPVP